MKLEILEKGYYYHIYNRGINGCDIFPNNDNKRYFLSLLKQYLIPDISVFAYCLMDNHFHLVIRIEDDTELIQKVSNFFNAYAKAFNKQQNRTGSLFEKHFKRVRLESEVYLRNLIVYVHLNPMHHLDQDFTKFHFSSYVTFLSNKPTTLARNEMLELFGGFDNFVSCHSARQEFLNETYTFE